MNKSIDQSINQSISHFFIHSFSFFSFTHNPDSSLFSITTTIYQFIHSFIHSFHPLLARPFATKQSHHSTNNSQGRKST